MSAAGRTTRRHRGLRAVEERLTDTSVDALWNELSALLPSRSTVEVAGGWPHPVTLTAHHRGDVIYQWQARSLSLALASAVGDLAPNPKETA